MKRPQGRHLDAVNRLRTKDTKSLLADLGYAYWIEWRDSPHESYVHWYAYEEAWENAKLNPRIAVITSGCARRKL